MLFFLKNFRLYIKFESREDEEGDMVLISIYIFIIMILLFLMNSFGEERIRKKKMVIAVLALMDIILFTYLYLAYGESIIQIGIALSAVIFCYAVYRVIRDKKRTVKEFFFVLEPGTYIVESRAKMDVAPKPIMKSVTEISWNGKLITMPPTFSCQGECLELICMKMERESEKYSCMSYNVKNKKRSVKRSFLTGSLIFSVFAIPTCIYFSLTDLVMEAHWITLGKGFLVTLVFGFAYFILYREEKNLLVKIMRCVFGIGYLIGISGIVMGLFGNIV